MASSTFPFPVTVKHHNHRRPPTPQRDFLATNSNHFISFCSCSSLKIKLHSSFSFCKRNSRFNRCCAKSSPSDPPSEPPTKNPQPPSSGASAKDTLQIFFAVLFWMSLFFWSCAWDHRNNGRDKGSRFWK